VQDSNGQCTAWGGSGQGECVLRENHRGDHRDLDGNMFTEDRAEY
jgi:hypothetical protein